MRFTVALEQRHSLSQKLSNDAANGPHINCPSVFLDLQQQLRSAVPKRDDLPGERTMRFFYNSKGRSYQIRGPVQNLQS